eukprot:UN02607
MSWHNSLVLYKYININKPAHITTLYLFFITLIDLLTKYKMLFKK